MDFIKRSSNIRPILTGIILMLVALIFRITDIFILHLDELWGEILLSKALGFCLVVVFLWLIGKNLNAIGLETSGFGQGLLIGAILAVVPFIVSYTVEWIVLAQSGENPGLLFAAIDPKAGVTGGLLFGLWLVAGNLVNAFMEEGLFRGVMLKLFRAKLSFLRANWLQAALFGAWHLVWVVKWYQTGSISTPAEIGMAIVSNFVPQLLMGFVWGYTFLKTGNLWIPWAAHTVTNTVLNLAHVTSTGGMDTALVLRMVVFTIASLLMIFAIRFAARRWNMREMPVWKNFS
jgi:membrane protease YdiL (CAAX protease family)